MATFTVTATEGGSTTNGIALLVKVITGQAASQPGTVAGATQTGPNLSITPQATGSLVYGAIIGLSGTYTAEGSTTLVQNSAHAGLQFVEVRTTSTTTALTPEFLTQNRSPATPEK